MGPRRHDQRRLRAHAWFRHGVGAALVLGCVAAAAISASGASSTTVVSASVPTATTLVNSCTAPSAREFGVVQPGSPALTATGAGVCRFDFSSSNASAQLRLGTADASGQAMTTGFTLSTSSPGGDPSYDAAISAGGTAVVVRALGTVQRSTDFGMAWSATHGAGLPYDGAGTTGAWWWYAAAVSPTDPQRLWAGGGPGWVARSLNGGTSWERIAVPATVSGLEVLDVEAVSDSTVFVLANGGGVVRLLRTTTANAATAAGVTWDIDQVVPGSWAGGLAAIDASNVWAATSAGLYRSTTGGTGPYNAKPPGWSNQVNDVDAVSSTSVVAIGQDGKVAVTSTGLASPPTWTNRHVPEELNHLATVEMVDASTWFVAGDRGAWHRTTTAGVSWTRVQAASLETPRELLAWDASRAIVVSDGRRISATANGTAWSVRDSGPAARSPMMSVAAIEGSQVAVGVGSEGTIHRSTNSGTSYSLVTSPTTNHLYGVSSSPLDASTVVAVGRGGTALWSGDAGLTWNASSSTGTAEDLLAVTAIDQVTAIAVGRGGTVVRTTNGGVSWLPLTLPAATTLYAVDVVLGTDIVLVGAHDGKVYRSTNGGSSWSAITLPGWGAGVAALDVVDGDDVVWASDGWDHTQLSLDGGITWTLKTGHQITPYGLAAVSEDIVLQGSYTGQLSYTRDGGATWTTQKPSNHDGLFWDVDAWDTNRAVASGSAAAPGRFSPGASIADYENDGVGADDDWLAGSGTDLFAVCLQAVGGTTTPVWGVDANATCTASDSDPWRAVPNGSAQVATTSGPGVAGRVDLVWGFRPASNQPAGRYRAGIFVEALAP